MTGVQTCALPIYQTLIGAWPLSKERLVAYMEKATREAKEQTSWTQQNKEFEDALNHFIERIYESQTFISEVESFVKRVLAAGHINGLAQSLLRYTAPGIPDTYQGGELWDLRLVDPDNRTPVDYELRQSMLNELKSGMTPEDIMRRSASGLPKLWVTHSALRLRREHPEWFGAEASYTPLIANGLKAPHVISFLRGKAVITLVPRWPLKRGDSWAGTTVELPEGRWKNVLTSEILSDGRMRIQSLLHRFPVALLVRESE